MPRRRRDEARILGPYYYTGAGWRVVFVNAEGGRVNRVFATKKEADDEIARIQALWNRLTEITVDKALDDYDQHLSGKGNKDTSRTETLRRLRLFFTDAKKTLSRITPEIAAGYYAAFSRGRSVDYHRNTLAEAKSFLRWCIGEKWIKSNPLDEVKGKGKRRKGKRQLHGDEARKFASTAIEMAKREDNGALGAVMLLLLGLRQSEVWRRQVRDLDLDGTVLRISGAKTETGNRAVEVPEVLQPLLRALAVDRLPSAPLFAAADGGHHTKSWLRAAVRRVCDRAGVTQVTPHGLRGTFSTLAQSAGAQGHVVAAQLGHASVSTTREHYTDAETVQAAEQRRALSVIEGGKR